MGSCTGLWHRRPQRPVQQPAIEYRSHPYHHHSTLAFPLTIKRPYFWRRSLILAFVRCRNPINWLISQNTVMFRKSVLVDLKLLRFLRFSYNSFRKFVGTVNIVYVGHLGTRRYVLTILFPLAEKICADFHYREDFYIHLSLIPEVYCFQLPFRYGISYQQKS